jgi:hypothetical protein
MMPIGIYLSISRSSIIESGVIQPWAIFPLLGLNNDRFNRLLEVSVFMGEYHLAIDCSIIASKSVFIVHVPILIIPGFII